MTWEWIVVDKIVLLLLTLPFLLVQWQPLVKVLLAAAAAVVDEEEEEEEKGPWEIRFRIPCTRR